MGVGSGGRGGDDGGSERVSAAAPAPQSGPVPSGEAAEAAVAAEAAAAAFAAAAVAAAAGEEEEAVSCQCSDCCVGIYDGGCSPGGTYYTSSPDSHRMQPGKRIKWRGSIEERDPVRRNLMATLALGQAARPQGRRLHPRRQQ